MAKSVYYYTLSKIDKDDKNKEIIDKIKEIFINKERYGYRRITLELRNQGYNVNNKKVYRIMVKLGLKPLKRNKRKYSDFIYWFRVSWAIYNSLYVKRKTCIQWSNIYGQG